MDIEEWPPIIRWILFIPAGFICTSLTQGIIRLTNSQPPYIAEILALAAEPWAFLIPAVSILPKGRKYFLIIFGVLYCLIHVANIYSHHNIRGYSASPWADTFLNLVALTSCISSILWLYSEILLDHKQSLS